MAKSNMDQDILKVLFSEQEIHDRIQEMGNQLYDEFHDRNPLFVGVLNGLLPVYGGSGAGHPVQERGGVHSACPPIRTPPSPPAWCRSPVICSGISPAGTSSWWRIFMDSGNTLYFLKDYMLAKGANSITIVTLLDKPSRRGKAHLPRSGGL